MEHAQPRLCLIVPAAALLAFAAWCYVSFRPDFSWDDAEPEILNQAWRLARGDGIYRSIDAAPFAFAAYPPLYYALVAAMLKFTGLSFVPAKLVSVAAALSIGWALASLDSSWNGRASGGIWCGFLLFLVPAFLYNAVRSHVQMMAVALSIWSLVFFLRNSSTATLIWSPLLAVLAVYTKQTQLALPLAMAAYLALRNRRRLLPYVLIGAAAGLIPLMWLQRTTNGCFLFDTFQLARLEYSITAIPLVFLHHAGPMCVFIGIAAHTMWRRFREGTWEAVDLYLASVLVTTLISLGRLGAHGQYVLELLVVTLVYLLRAARLPTLPGREALVTVQVIFLFVYTAVFIVFEEGRWDVAANRAAKRVYPMLAAEVGPVLSQQGSFALFSRGEIYVQLFHFSALSRAGLWDQRLLLRDVDKQIFCRVITEFPVENAAPSASDRERFTPELLQAIRRNYARSEAIYPYYLYRPKSPRS